MDVGTVEAQAASVARSSSGCWAGWQPSGEDEAHSGLASLDLSSELAGSPDSGAFDAQQGLPGTVSLLEVAAFHRRWGCWPSSGTAAGCERRFPDYPGCTRPEHGHRSLKIPGRAVAAVADCAAGCPEEQNWGRPSSFSSSGRDVGASGTSIGPSSPISSP